MIPILAGIREGRRAAFDKKSHKRVWVRTQRLTYTFFAAELLEAEDPESLSRRIMEHLEGAQEVIQDLWGKSEVNRLTDTPLAALEEDLRETLSDALGEQKFQEIKDRRIGELAEPTLKIVAETLGKFTLTRIYRELFLRVISELWVEYLTEMEALRVSIGLEAYAQRDPLVQYKTKGFEMFQRLMDDMRYSLVNRMFTFRPRNISRVQAGLEEETDS
jgi:preprotein translocase subunit SecA